MPTFTPVYLNDPTYTVSRGLVQGVCIRDLVVDSYVKTGRVLTWTIGTVRAEVAFKAEYFDWNSGLWQLQDVWDIESCHVYVLETEVDGGVFFFTDYLAGKSNLVQCCSIFFPASSEVVFELPPAPADYWLRLPDLS
jgi:hypothetical protein